MSTTSSGPVALAQVLAGKGISVAQCYQCGKCSAGCPLAWDMDITPSQLLHMLQLEHPRFDEEVLRSLTIWLCLTCETCYARCPKEIDLPTAMDVLRAESLQRGMVNPKAKDIIAFHRAFLDSIRAFGRLSEVALIADYKARTFHLLQDVPLAPKLLRLGKLKLLPERIRERRELARIFRKAGVSA